MHKLALLVLLLAAGACAPLPGEESGAAITPAEPGACPPWDWSGDGICSDACDTDCYQIFPTQEEALRAFAEHPSPDQPLADEGPPDGEEDEPDAEHPPVVVVPLGDPRYAVASAALARLWPAVRTLFPRHVRDLPLPWIVLTENDTGGSVIPDGGRVLYAISIDVSELARGDAAVMTILSHEIVHLAFKHGAVQLYSARFYRAPAGQEPIGFLQGVDDQVRALLLKWGELAESGGRQPWPELDGLPVEGRSADMLEDILLTLAPSPEACGPATDEWDHLGHRVRETFSELTATWQPDDAERAAIATDVARVRQGLVDCLGSVRVSLTDLLARLPGGEPPPEDEPPPEGLPPPTSGPTDAERALFDAEPNPIDGLRALVRATHAEMRALWISGDLATARAYDAEEEADDVSIRILRAAGLDPAMPPKVLVESLPSEDRARCEALLTAGQIPPYGDLLESHRASCFRAFHARQVAEHWAAAAAASSPSPR